MQVRERLRTERPLMLDASSRCVNFVSNLHEVPHRCRAFARKGIQHLTFASDLYREQLDNGSFFLREHSACAESWNLWMAQDLWKKPSGCMTKSTRIFGALGCKCSGNRRHCHMRCFAGPVRARGTEWYPLRNVRGINSLEAGQHFDELDVWLTHQKFHQEIYGAITDVQLDPKLASTARIEEMKFVGEESRALQARHD